MLYIDSRIYTKLRAARELARRVPNGLEIEVDGGVNVENARMLLAAGADVLVSGSYIFRGGNPRQRIRALLKAIHDAYVDYRQR